MQLLALFKYYYITLACCQLTVILIGTYERALKEQESVDVAYARLMLLGSAGTGKTCLKHSLMEQPYDPHTTSTIVSDVSTVRPFGHEWQTMSGNKWREVKPEDEIEELAYLFKNCHSRLYGVKSNAPSVNKSITTTATIKPEWSIKLILSNVLSFSHYIRVKKQALVSFSFLPSKYLHILVAAIPPHMGLWWSASVPRDSPSLPHSSHNVPTLV